MQTDTMAFKMRLTTVTNYYIEYTTHIAIAIIIKKIINIRKLLPKNSKNCVESLPFVYYIVSKISTSSETYIGSGVDF